MGNKGKEPAKQCALYLQRDVCFCLAANRPHFGFSCLGIWCHFSAVASMLSLAQEASSHVASGAL